jgi:hypothetical protein
MSRKYRLDRKQETHLTRLEDAALRIHECDPLAFKFKTGLEFCRS